MNKYYRAVVYLKEDDRTSDSLSQGMLKTVLYNYYNGDDYVICEFEETNEHKFNRAKDNEVK